MKKLHLALAIVLLITTTSFAQLANLDYTGYHLAIEDDFNYPDPTSTYPSFAFQIEPTFESKWAVDMNPISWPCLGWGHEIMRATQVSMPSYGIIRLKEEYNPTFGCDSFRGWGLLPINHISGLLQSKFSVSFGIIEASIKLPKGTCDGLCEDDPMDPLDANDTAAYPAFWTYPLGVERDNEIDIIDNFDSDDMKLRNHLFFTPPGTIPRKRHFIHRTIDPPSVGNLSSDFHKYSCVWTPSRIVFYIDEIYLSHIDYAEGQTYPTYQTVIMNLQTHTNTVSGLTMDIDWFKFWVQNCDESDFNLTTATLGSPSVTDIMTYPNLPTDHSKKAQYSILKNKNVNINVPYSYNGNVVRHVSDSITFIEAESVTILPDFIADESVLHTNRTVNWDNQSTTTNEVSNGYMEIRSIQCGTNSTSWFKTAPPTNIRKGDVRNTKNISDVIIYPNPTNGNFNVKLPEQGDYHVEVVNMIGQIIYVENIKNTSSWNAQLKDMIFPGTYSIHVKGKALNYYGKIIVIN